MRAGRPQDPDRAPRDGPAAIHEVVSHPTTLRRAFPPSPPLPHLVTLAEQVIAGPEWEGLDRSYRVADYLLAFADAFDAAIDRMVEHDPYLVAEDMCTMLEWHGGVRAFDAAVRLGTDPIREEPTDGERHDEAPLAGWGHLLALSGEARVAGTPFSKDLAEAEKKKVGTFLFSGLELRLNGADCKWVRRATRTLSRATFRRASSRSPPRPSSTLRTRPTGARSDLVRCSL